jgi:hypothetical protein
MVPAYGAVTKHDRQGTDKKHATLARRPRSRRASRLAMALNEAFSD